MATYEIVNDAWAKKVCDGYRIMNPSKADLNDNQILNRLIEISFNDMVKYYRIEMENQRVARCEHKNVERSDGYERCKDCGGHRFVEGRDDNGGWGGHWGPWRA